MTQTFTSHLDVGLRQYASREPVRHLYAHVPFCPSKCDYCAFVTHVGSKKLIEPYVEAIVREASMRSRAVSHAPLATIYLGGGTPSMLSPAQIGSLLSNFEQCFGFEPSAEITMEAHPATVDSETLAGYLKAGVTRLSFGIESTARSELDALGRLGDETSGVAALADARAVGFGSIAADLMYGIPRQTTTSWNETLDRVLACGPDHLSLYPLAIEAKTVFDRRWRQHQLAVPDDEHVVEMYHLACEVLNAAGFIHYEVGSWCRTGHHSRHNLAYWHNREFLGLGVGAHAYLSGQRTVNVGQTSRYIRLISAGADPVIEAEDIGPALQRAETIMLNLRLLDEGLDMDVIEAEFGWNLRQSRGTELESLARDGMVRVEGSRVLLSESAVPLANEVWERLAF